MKKIGFAFLFTALLAQHAFAQTFVETIAQLSARDAVTIADTQLYASNYNTGFVYRIELDGTVSTVLGQSNRGPAGIRLDQDNNIYVALYNEGEIIKIDVQGSESVFAENVREPIALDWDSNGNLFVSNFAGDTTVTRIAPDGSKSNYASISQLNRISSLCVDSNDDVYVTSYFSGDIYRVTPAGDVSLFASSDVEGYAYLQFDEINQIFYATVTNSNSLMKFAMDGTSEVIINSQDGGVVDGPLDIARVDSAIGLAVSDTGKHVYFATNTHIRRLNIADPNVDQVRPYFTSEPAASVDVGDDLIHKFEFIDPNNDPLMLSIENLPDWMTFDGISELNGIPGDSLGGQVVTVEARLEDGFDVVSQTLSVTINNAPAPPPPPPPASPTTPEPAPVDSSGGAISIWIYVLLMLRLASARMNKKDT